TVARGQLDSKLARRRTLSGRLGKHKRPLAPVGECRIRVCPIEAAAAQESTAYVSRPEDQPRVAVHYFLNPDDRIERRVMAILSHEISNLPLSTQRLQVHITVAARDGGELLALTHIGRNRSADRGHCHGRGTRERE